MILTCPSCGTQYAVKDGAIPAQGRKVRCASCGESWHQQPEGEEGATNLPPTEVPEEPQLARSASDTAEIQENTGPSSEEDEGLGFSTVPPIAPGPMGVESPSAVPTPAGDGWDIASREEMEREFDPDKGVPDAAELGEIRAETGEDRRRNWGMAVALGLVLVIALATAFFLLAPDSLRRSIGIGSANASPLQITAQGGRQKLASGNELLVVNGRVVNPSSEAQQVPAIQAQLLAPGGKILHTWTIPPPARTLPPGGSASFSSAEMDVPSGGDDVAVSFNRPARG